MRLNVFTLSLIATYLVRRHRVASWLQHWGRRHLIQHQPSRSEVLFVVPAYRIDRIRQYQCMLRTITLNYYQLHKWFNTVSPVCISQ